ncbi:C40 family peptidase [Amnibacterium endophyticum]
MGEDRVGPSAHDGRARSAPRRSRSRTALSAVVMTIAAGLVATIALPSYAVNPLDRNEPKVEARSVTETGQQRFEATAEAATAELQRDKFTATSSAVLLRRQYAAQFAYDGPSAADYLKNPDHPPFSLQAVYNRGLDYLGVPYVFGGADPSGFDCSGFIMYVYAQFGVALPHSVTSQDAIGQTISPEDAQPGDVVIFNDHSHDGFYAGDGKILHAPYPGARVRVQQLWTSNVHFVRFGI